MAADTGRAGGAPWLWGVKSAVETGLLICSHGSFWWHPSDLSRFVLFCPLRVEPNCTWLVLFLVQALQSVWRRGKHGK